MISQGTKGGAQDKILKQAIKIANTLRSGSLVAEKDPSYALNINLSKYFKIFTSNGNG